MPPRVSPETRRTQYIHTETASDRFGPGEVINLPASSHPIGNLTGLQLYLHGTTPGMARLPRLCQPAPHVSGVIAVPWRSKADGRPSSSTGGSLLCNGAVSCMWLMSVAHLRHRSSAMLPSRYALVPCRHTTAEWQAGWLAWQAGWRMLGVKFPCSCGTPCPLVVSRSSEASPARCQECITLPARP